MIKREERIGRKKESYFNSLETKESKTEMSSTCIGCAKCNKIKRQWYIRAAVTVRDLREERN